MIVLTAIFAFLWCETKKKVALFNEGITVKPDMGTSISGLKARSIIFAFLAFVPMYVVNAMMKYVGNDYQNYYVYYERIISGGEQEVEFTYKLICMLVFKLGIGFQGVYFVYCLLSYTILLLCIRKYSGNYAVSYLMFFLNGYFPLLGLQQIRQFVAVVLVFYAYDYIRKRKLIPYIIFVLIAGCFHVTALIMLPFYWILHIKWKASAYLVVISVLLPLMFFHSEIMQWLFQTFMPRYLNSNYSTRGFGIGIQYFCMIVITLIIGLYYENINSKETVVFKNCLILSNIIAIFANWLPEYQRFVFYFFFPTVAYIPMLIENEQNKKKKVFVYLVLLGVYAWYFMCTFPKSTINPYKSILG